MGGKPPAERRGLRLPYVIANQVAFAAASVGYLLTSLYLEVTSGAGLSAAPMAFSLIAFAVYFACLFLPRFGMMRSYRTVMVIALILFGGGGVIGNIVRYFQTGLEQYASFYAWIIAVAINSYGTIFNFIAASGWFRSKGS